MHRPLSPAAATLLTTLLALCGGTVFAAPTFTSPTTTTTNVTACAAPVTTGGAYRELEPNSSKETATPLPAGVVMLGQNYGTGDTDWYYFQTTSTNEFFSMSFTVGGLVSGDTATWRLKLEDAGGNTLAQREAILTGTDYVDGLSAALANPGYYFLSITPVVLSDLEYSIVTSQQVSAQPAAASPPSAVVFRSRRLRLPVVEVQTTNGVDYYDATLEQTGGNTFELTDAVPLD